MRLDELLQTIVDLCSRETDSERGTLFLIDEETGELYSRVAQGLDIREIRIMKDSGVAGRVFTTGEGMIIEDAYSNPLFDRSIDQETRYVTRNLACAPIRFKGEMIGVLQVLNKKSGAYTKEDLRLLEAMAEHTAITLRSALFRERTKAIREQEMRFLNFVAEVGSDFELGAMLTKIVTEAAQMLKADRATLFLHDPKRQELFSRVAMGHSVGEIRIPDHVGIAGAVFTSGETINLPYAYADLRFNPAQDRRTGYFTRSILCVPIVNKAGKIIGVTQALNKKGGPFTDGGRGASEGLHRAAGHQPGKRQAVRRCAEHEELQRKHAAEHVHRRGHAERGRPHRHLQCSRPGHSESAAAGHPESDREGVLRGTQCLDQ